MSTSLTYALAFCFTVMLFLSYTVIDQQAYYSAPIDANPDLGTGIMPGMLLFAEVDVLNNTLRAYELAMASHAPLSTPGKTEPPLNGTIKVLDERDDPMACTSLEYSDLTGAIVLVRRGKCNLFSKVAHCQSRGARAVLISEDPIEAVRHGQHDSEPPTEHNGEQNGEHNGEHNGELPTEHSSEPNSGHQHDQLDAPHDFLYDDFLNEHHAVTTQSITVLKIPAMIVPEAEYRWLLVHTNLPASVWTLSPELDPSVLRLLMLLFVRPLIMLTVVLILVFVNLHSKKMKRRLPASLVWSLPRRRWDPAREGMWHQNECSICLEEFTPHCEIMTLPCSHEFHVHCVSQWLIRRRGVCPLCFQEVQTENTPLLAGS